MVKLQNGHEIGSFFGFDINYLQMKKIGQIFAIMIITFFTVFFACKKDENEQMIDIITSKSWRYGLTDLNASTNPNNPTYYAVLDCEKDDTFTFRTDGTMVRTFGAKKCDGETGNSKTYNYSFNKDTRELIIDDVKYTVVEENKSQFKYYRAVPNVTGSNNMIYLLH